MILPNLWRLVSIGDIATTVGGGTPSREMATYFSGNIPWLTGSDLPEDSVAFVQSSRQFITEEAIHNSATTPVLPNTLLVTTRVSVGKVAIAQTRLCFSQDITGLIFEEKEVANPEYIGFYLMLHRQDLLRLNRGTTITGITRSDLEKVQIPLPPLPEQQRIVTILRQTDELRRLRRQANERARVLLPALFQEIWNDQTIQRKTKSCLKALLHQ
jgi:type I restriction enzyme S subunit